MNIYIVCHHIYNMNAKGYYVSNKCSIKRIMSISTVQPYVIIQQRQKKKNIKKNKNKKT